MPVAKAHREIASLVNRIRKIDDASDSTDNLRKSWKKKKTRKSNVFDEFHVAPERDEEAGRGDWGDSSTLEDDDSISGKRQIQADEAIRPSPTVTKAQSKRAKHCGSVQVITSDLMDAIAVALHPERPHHGPKANLSAKRGSSPLSNEIIHDNISFNTNCFEPKSLRQSHRARKLLQANGGGKVPPLLDPQNDPDITFALECLGIPHCPQHASKERSSLEKQLRIAVREDLQKVENEDQETMMRMAGYWRYVNRKTYNFMVRQNQIWDWATGEKLEEVEDNDEDGFTHEIDEDIDTTSWDDASTVDVPGSRAVSPITGVRDCSGIRNASEMNPGTIADISTQGVTRDKRYKQLEIAEDLSATPKATQNTLTTLEHKPQEPLRDNRVPFTPSPAALLSSLKEDVESRNPQPNLTSETAETYNPTRFQGLNIYSYAATVQSRQDPNNRYTTLGEVNEQAPPCHLMHSKRALKIIPENVTVPEEMDGAWSTMKGKTTTRAGKMGSAGTLMKKKNKKK
ncbi:MAG: hypothetical protein Q9220_002785 [cf. Caloplaca sp. 1 TL-2023]